MSQYRPSVSFLRPLSRPLLCAGYTTPKEDAETIPYFALKFNGNVAILIFCGDNPHTFPPPDPRIAARYPKPQCALRLHFLRFPFWPLEPPSRDGRDERTPRDGKDLSDAAVSFSLVAFVASVSFVSFVPFVPSVASASSPKSRWFANLSWCNNHSGLSSHHPFLRLMLQTAFEIRSRNSSARAASSSAVAAPSSRE